MTSKSQRVRFGSGLLPSLQVGSGCSQSAIRTSHPLHPSKCAIRSLNPNLLVEAVVRDTQLSSCKRVVVDSSCKRKSGLGGSKTLGNFLAGQTRGFLLKTCSMVGSSP